MDTSDTPNYGLTRVGQGESLAKNGFAALDADRVTLDALLHALEFHSHDAITRLADPEELEPDFVAAATGGQLPAGATLYYTVSLLDRWSLETAVCTEGSVTTPAALTIDGAPAVTAFSSGGTLTPGQYSYVYTYVAATGGETETSLSTSVRIASGTANRCEIDIPDLPATALYANVYRSRDGQSQFFYCGEHDGLTDFFTDDGATMNYTVVAPRVNTTGGTCSVTVDLSGWPVGTWEGVYGWRLYRTLASGEYSGTSLVHEVVETESEGSAVLRKTWIDDGDELQPGMPKGVSSTLSGGAVIDMTSVQGQLPVTALPRGGQCLTFSGPQSGTMFDGTSQFPKIVLPYEIRPIAFQLSTTGVLGRDSTPCTIELKSTGGATVGGTVAVVLDDNSGLYSASWAIDAAPRVQGESMVRSSEANVVAVSDLNASSGAAVELDTQGEYVEYEFDLEPGTWQLRLRHRFTGELNNTDLHYTFFDGNTDPDAAFAGAGTVDATYTTVEPAGATITWAGGPLVVRITKTSTTVTTHLIDWVEMYTGVPTIPAGQAYISYTPPGAGNVGTHHVWTLWY